MAFLFDILPSQAPALLRGGVEHQNKGLWESPGFKDWNELTTSSPLQDTIPILQKAVIGFDLLGGTQAEQAKKLAKLLNEQVPDMFCHGHRKGALRVRLT